MVNNKRRVRGNRTRDCPRDCPRPASAATQRATSRRARAITLADYIRVRPSHKGSNKGSNKPAVEAPALGMNTNETDTNETNTNDMNTDETNTDETITNDMNTNETDNAADKHYLIADTPPRSPTAASPLKRAYSNGSNDSTQSDEPRVDVVEKEPRVIVQPRALESHQQMIHQIALEEACWALNPMAVLLLLAEGRQGLCLGGVDRRDGNSPLQMAVDGLIYQLDHLRHDHRENVAYREACRRNFRTIMTTLVKHMTLPELQNWNNYDRTNAVGKLAFHAFDWRLLQDLIEAMNRLSGDPSGDPMFRYNPGSSCKGYEAVVMPWENDSHVVGCLCEKFWDPLNQWWAVHVHPCGTFVL